MKSIDLKFNFDNITGKVKAMHAVGQPPMLGIDTSRFKYLKEANIPYSRLHDVGGMFGKNIFVDIPNIFRDFSADVEDPESYDFKFTDILMKALIDNNCEPYFRLGVTIENYIGVKAYRIFPPADNEKWARICEHIIKHYNYGWANGFNFNVKYWEIWNEPDNGRDNRENMMWHGTKEEYYELYRVTSKHLRKVFGDSIKIGGYGHSGFYDVDTVEDIKKSITVGLALKEVPTDWEKRTRYFITFFDGFIDMVTKENLPLDFFSHHSYASVESTLKRQKYVEGRLALAGLENVEIHLNEWQPLPSKETRGKDVACANTVAMMCAMQKTKMDMMCYYDAQIGVSIYGGMFNPLTYEPFCVYYGFKAFGKLYEMQNCVESSDDSDGVFSLAAKGNGKKGAIIVNTGEDAQIKTNLPDGMTAYLVDEQHFLEEIKTDTGNFVLPKDKVIYIEG
ncbi:MAG: hypothetical protein IJO74_00070 [Clostridia bacterium]|nr:hypothetical protein [Clostridia bacterium]